MPPVERMDLFNGRPHAEAVVELSGSNDSRGYQAPPHWLIQALRVTALGLGCLHTAVAVARQSMNEDGINYLDMGALFLNGEWGHAVNGIWSPLYAWIIGAVVHVVHPTVWWEFPVVQMANFVIYAAALGCFEFFWRQLTREYFDITATPGAGARFPPVVWLTLGYSLFIWSSLNLIEIWAVTPDMLVAALVYVAAGLLLRLGGSEATRWKAVSLGAVLGIGYLAKAALFPLGLAGLLIAALLMRSPVGVTTRLVWSFGAFAIVAGPLVIALSFEAGHVTFGDVGRFTYLKHVNGLRYPHWDRSVERVGGSAEHPPRLAFDSPPVYEFAGPVRGTYPLSFDPGYWTQGLSPRIDAGQQLRVLISNVSLYFDLFVRNQGGFLAILLLLCALVLHSRAKWQFRTEAALVTWGICALALFAFVYVTGRYVAPFIVLFWSGLLASVRLPDVVPYRRMATAGGVILVLAVWVNIGAQNLEGLAGLLGFSAESAQPRIAAEVEPRFTGTTDHPAIADGLMRLGVRQGDSVGLIGDSFTAFWARLARVRIVAEIPAQHADRFWDAEPELQVDVLRIFADAGARVVVAEGSDTDLSPNGWKRVTNTGYFVRFLH